MSKTPLPPKTPTILGSIFGTAGVPPLQTPMLGAFNPPTQEARPPARQPEHPPQEPHDVNYFSATDLWTLLHQLEEDRQHETATMVTALNTVQARLDRMENNRHLHQYGPFEMRGARAAEDTFQPTRPALSHLAPLRFGPSDHQTQGHDKFHFNSQHTFPEPGQDSSNLFDPHVHLRRGGNRPDYPANRPEYPGNRPDYPARRARDDEGDRGQRSERPTEKVRAKELRDFDEEGVEFFIRSLEMMANLYGDQAVCAAIPKCMKGAAKDWITSLDYREVKFMQSVDR